MSWKILHHAEACSMRIDLKGNYTVETRKTVCEACGGEFVRMDSHRKKCEKLGRQPCLDDACLLRFQTAKPLLEHLLHAHPPKGIKNPRHPDVSEQRYDWPIPGCDSTFRWGNNYTPINLPEHLRRHGIKDASKINPLKLQLPKPSNACFYPACLSDEQFPVRPGGMNAKYIEHLKCEHKVSETDLHDYSWPKVCGFSPNLTGEDGPTTVLGQKRKK